MEGLKWVLFTTGQRYIHVRVRYNTASFWGMGGRVSFETLMKDVTE